MIALQSWQPCAPLIRINSCLSVSSFVFNSWLLWYGDLLEHVQKFPIPNHFVVLALSFLFTTTFAQQTQDNPGASAKVFGFRDFSQQYQIDQRFLAVPDPKRAEQHLKILTALPHIAGSVEDHNTAEYVHKQFHVAGLDSEIVEYRVWMNRPAEISVSVTAPANVKMNGPTREKVDGDTMPDNPKVVMPLTALALGRRGSRRGLRQLRLAGRLQEAG